MEFQQPLELSGVQEVASVQHWQVHPMGSTPLPRSFAATASAWRWFGLAIGCMWLAVGHARLAQAACDANHPVAGCCAGNVLQSCNAQGNAVDLQCSSVNGASGPHVCAHDKLTASQIACVDTSAADFSSVQPYCAGYCKPGCVGETCAGNCSFGEVCNDGICKPKACGRMATWLDSYVEAAYLKNNPTTLAAGQNLPTGAGIRSACSSSSGNFGFAVRDDGTLLNWGTEPQAYPGLTGQVLNNPAMANIKDALQVACGDYAVVVRRKDGTVSGWGYTGDKFNSWVTSTPPANLTNVTSVVAGGLSYGALKADGSVVLWGWDEWDSYGPLNGKTGFKALAAGVANGGANFVAVKTDGSVVLAARDFDANGGPVAFPAPPAGLTGVVSVAIGRWQALAVKQDGTVVAWGSKGEAPPADLKKAVSVAVSTLAYGNAQAFYTPSSTMLALQVDGTIRAWGGIHPAGLAKVAKLQGVNFLDPHGGIALYCTGSCGAISPIGCCDGNNVHTCNAFGQDVVSACANGTCGWQSASQKFQCSTSGGPAPGNSPLQSCVCVPNCKNPNGSTKQCGSDSCGGTCGNGSCDDGDPCTANDTCDGALCVAGTPLDCSDGNACTTDTCSAATTFTTQSVCGKAAAGQDLTLTCPAGQTITGIQFAKTGAFANSCPNLAAGAVSCLVGDTSAMVQQACIGKSSCTVNSTKLALGPVPVTMGLSAHFDATVADSVVVGAGGLVNQWQDVSGHGRHLVVSAKGKQPVYGAKLINGQPALDFDGADRQLVSGAFPLAKVSTIFAVIQWRTADQWGAITHHGNRDMDWSLEQSALSSLTTIHYQTDNQNTSCNLVLKAGTDYVLSGRQQNINFNWVRQFTAHANGTAPLETEGVGNSVSPGVKAMYVGSSDAMEDSRAYIGELVYFDRSLSDDEFAAVRNWLRQKWQLDAPKCADTSLGVVANCESAGTSNLCGMTQNQDDKLTLSCPPGTIIADIPFASYGTPGGSCPNPQKGTCDSPNNGVVKAACLGKSQCTIAASDDTFQNNPCPAMIKNLAVRAVCAPFKTSCNYTNALQPCDDANACTSGDTCQNGNCAGGSVLDCDDNSVCTNDACDPTKGCKHSANTGACTDGNVCTLGDICSGGSCVAGPGAANCDDGNPCTTDTCDNAKGCQHADAVSATPCDDNNSCTQNDACAGGLCKGAGSDSCDDGNPCTTDDCLDANTCAPHTAVADGKACSDGNACHLGGTCTGGQCGGWNGQACNDGNPCTNDNCDAKKGCVATNNTAPCSDNSVCTVVDTCQSGACVGSGSLNCDDKNPCTTDSCDPTMGCQHANADSKPCDDGNVCTQGDSCSGGACAGGGAKSCDDGMSCTTDTCQAVLGCQHAQNTEPCDDDNACSSGDACWQGTCIGGGKPACNDGNACTNDACNSKTGCTYTANSKLCSDGSACTVGDSCSGGACKPGSTITCDDKNPCTTDSCAPSVGCVFVNNSLACNDASSCTDYDVCAGGKCAGTAKNCDDKNLCTTDTCDDKTGCAYANNTAGCSDGNPCTVKDACTGGKCAGGKPNSCDDGNPCTADLCDTKWGCLHDAAANLNVACNDGSSCSFNDQCVGGSCSGSSVCQNAGCALVNGQPGCVCKAGQKQVATTSKVQPIACCTPDCANKTCGDDGCGGTCGICGSNETCLSSKGKFGVIYQSCTPKLACYGKAPVDVGCCDGRKLTTCSAPNSLTIQNCASLNLYCGWNEAFKKFTCTKDGANEPTGKYAFQCPGAAACVPDCAGKSCGPDGCGGTCGTCGDGKACVTHKGTCVAPCEGNFPLTGCVAQASDGKEVITTCPGIEAKASAAVQTVCDKGQKAAWSQAQGRFVCGGTDTPPAGTTATCPKVCSCGTGALANTCGDNGCGKSCGTCPSGKSCATTGIGAGQCFAACPATTVSNSDGTCCTPKCKGCTLLKQGKCYPAFEYTKTCGDDGCGGSCGTCGGVGQACTTAGVCAVEACSKAYVDSRGTCAGNQLQYCTATELLSQDCASAGGTCQTVNHYPMRACAPPAVHQCATNDCTQNAAWSCQCDANCVVRGDCCENFGSTCGPELAAGTCGDKACRPLDGEDCLTCSQDCSACAKNATANMTDAPYPRVIDRSGGIARAHYRISPLDDLRPSPPPIPTRGLVAWAPAAGASAGHPNGRVAQIGFQSGGKVSIIADGPGVSSAMSTRNGGASSFGALRLSSDRTWRGSASVATQSNGGFTVAGFVRLPNKGSDQVQALGSAQSLDWHGRSWQGGTHGYGLMREYFAVSRPKDSGLFLSCPVEVVWNNYYGSKLEPPSSKVVAVEAYYGDVVGPDPPLDGQGIGVSGDGYRAMAKTYACEYGDIQASVESACLGKTQCTIDPWLAAGNPCAAYAGAKDRARLMVRYMCAYKPLGPVLNLSVAPASAGGALRLQIVNQTVVHSASAMPKGAWTHVALTFEPYGPTVSVGRVQIAINGKIEGSADNVAIGQLVDWTWGAAELGGTDKLHPGACPGCSANGSSFDVAAIADFDNLMLYDRALNSHELKGLVAQPNLGVARVWPPVEAARVVRDGLWTTGGKPQLVPVAVPQLRDPLASQGNPDQALRADFDGLSVPKGAVLTMPAQGDDLTNLSKWTVGAWLRVDKVTTGTTLLEWKQGATSRLKWATGPACNGRALEVTFADGSKLSQTNCEHVLGDGVWQFVAVTQLSSGRLLELDGFGTTSTGSAVLFNATDTGPRQVVVTSAAALGWAALFERALTRDEVAATRSQGPSTWLSGTSAQTGPLDWAAYGNQSTAGKTDQASVVGSGSGPQLVVPAKGQLAALDGDAMRRATVVQTVLVPVTTTNTAYVLWQATAKTTGETGVLAAEAILDCRKGKPRGGAKSAIDCKFLVTQKTASGYATWVSAYFTLSFDDPAARVRTAIMLGDAPAVALGYQGITAGAKIVYTAQGGVDHSGSGRAWLPLLSWPSAVNGSVKSPAGDAFYAPGSTAATTTAAATTGTLKGVFDLRIYPRSLGVAERAASVQWGCAAATCDLHDRTCLESTAANANQLTVATCGGCSPGYREANGACVKLWAYGTNCWGDSECASGLCSRKKGPYYNSTWVNIGRCIYKTSSADCQSTCRKLGKACIASGLADKQGFLCEDECLADWIMKGIWYEWYKTCHWNPTRTFNDHCDNDDQCDTGLCASRTTKVYGVATDATSLGHGRDFHPVNADYGYWYGPYLECPDKAGCAVANLTQGNDKVCMAATPAQCTSVNMQMRSVAGIKWDGAATAGFVCEKCSSEQYAGQSMYREAWTLMSPVACQTMYDNYFSLLTAKDGVQGVYVGKTFYAKGVPRNKGGDILDQEPTLPILRRLILKDPDPTSLVTPQVISNLQKAGIGNDLLGWQSLPWHAQNAYRRKFTGKVEISHHAWLDAKKQLATYYDAFPIGACNMASYTASSSDYLVTWNYLKVGNQNGVLGNVATQASPFFDNDLNKPVCVPNKFPNGTTCPPAGKENEVQFSRAKVGDMCDSGFCAADSHVCDIGFGALEKLYGDARNDGQKGGSSNDLGPIALHQDQGAVFRLQQAAASVTLEEDTTDRRNYLLEAHSKQSISFFAKTLQVLDLSVSLAATPGAKETKQKATYKQEFLILGVQPPSLPKLPKLTCGASAWENGEYSGSGCKLVRQPIGVGVEKKSKGKTKEGEHGATYTKGVSVAGISAMDAATTSLVDASELPSVTFNIPLPIQDCPEGLIGFQALWGRACFAKQTTVGPVPFKVEAEMTPEVTVSFAAELDQETLEPAAVVTPAVAVAVEVKGGVGGSLGPLELFAGIKAAITIIELAFPVSFSIAFKEGIDPKTESSVTDVWRAQFLVESSIEVTFLKLALGLFFEVGIGPFTFSVAYEFFEYEGIKFKWPLADNIAHEEKVDFQWQPPTAKAK